MSHSKPRTDSPSSVESVSPDPLRSSSPQVLTGDGDDSLDLGALLRDAMAEPAPQVDVLSGVQQKLRERSGGKFYADRWSTERFSPIPMYLITSAVMLAIVLGTYLVLRPLSGEATKSPPPAPIRVLPTQNR